jgi:hypothetical protein
VKLKSIFFIFSNVLILGAHDRLEEHTTSSRRLVPRQHILANLNFAKWFIKLKNFFSILSGNKAAVL